MECYRVLSAFIFSPVSRSMCAAFFRSWIRWYIKLFRGVLFTAAIIYRCLFINAKWWDFGALLYIGTIPFFLRGGSAQVCVDAKVGGMVGDLISSGVRAQWNFLRELRESLFANGLVNVFAGYGLSAWWDFCLFFFGHWYGCDARNCVG